MSVTNPTDTRGPIPSYKKGDFATDQDVRWCPGCGDYAILAAVQRMLPKLPVRREDHVFISGIGCSSRFPYYMNTYGFHTIHGRAPAIASGLKATNPNLHVWIITGDGDSLSIGGNHLAHLLRRNFNVTLLLFNNRIYGLTKGQYSPTSEVGKRTKSTPMGSLDYPFNPVSFAIGSGATFVGRSFDVDAKHLTEVLTAAWKHKGAGFVEIYQNCNIFNDGAFASVTDKAQRKQAQLRLEPGQPMIFDDGQRGVAFVDGKPQIVSADADNVAVHDPSDPDPTRAFALSQLGLTAATPTPMGVLRSVEKDCYEDLMTAQIAEAQAQKTPDLHSLLHSGYTWTVKD